MKKVILMIDGMSCSACQNAVEKYLNKQDGVHANVNLVMAQALIEYDESKVKIADLENYINESGYKSLGVYNPKKEEKKNHAKFLLIVFGALLILGMIIHNAFFSLVLSIAFIIYGFDIIKSGIVKIFHLSPNMDTLVTIGVLSSFIYSLIVFMGNINKTMNNLYFDSVIMIIFFVKLGRFIESRSKEKTKEAIKELVTITPENAVLKTGKKEKIVTIDEISVGDTLICKPGMKVAVDGEITLGFAHFDESFITGESINPKKGVGNTVIAGSINLDGVIEYKALKIGPNSTISEIVRLVVEATSTKAPIAKMADKVSSYFVPGIVLIAIATLVINLIMGNNISQSLVSFVTVLVVACPCALGLATPLAIITSEGRLARNGVLIKKSEVLEEMNKIDTIVFDKTGTLTHGKLKISEINNFSTYSDSELLNIVSSLENNSSHPIAKAFPKGNITISQFENIAGIGLSGVINDKKYYVGNNRIVENLGIDNVFKNKEKELADQGNTIIYVVEENKIISLIGVNDLIREESKETIDELKKIGKDIVILSGDNDEVVSKIGKYLKIDNYVANMMPAWKDSYIQNLINEGHKVMMIGDGINDAPGLASSTIGVSVNGATDIAANSSDVILMTDDIHKIVELFSVSKKTLKIIKQNLFWAFFYNTIMIPIATGFFGISINPMLASMFMMISSLTVVFNSLRLRR